MKSFITALRDGIRFMAVPAAPYGLVIYSEGGAYAPFLRPVIDDLATTYDGVVHYLTSDANDPLLLAPPAHVRSAFIGSGEMRTFVLNNMKADVVAMTMPDLGSFQIQRSPKVGHYAYVHHSLVSTHMIYRTGAFDHFDSVLCVGPHHVEEIRAWEDVMDLSAKQLFEHGYPPLDTILAGDDHAPPPIGDDGRLNLLLAPSWGPNGLMETRAEDVVGVLLEAGHRVHARPHPMTRRLSPAALDALTAKFGGHPDFVMDEDTAEHGPLHQAHVMISDWSGVAMEFAFGLERPVVFIDVPRKINNPDYGNIAAVPFEESYRGEVGQIVPVEAIATLPSVLEDLVRDAPARQARIRALRQEMVYNIGGSARRGAEILAGLVSNGPGNARNAPERPA